MFRPLPFFIGVRYTRARRRSLFVSFISLTSIIGLALGVLVMLPAWLQARRRRENPKGMTAAPIPPHGS